MVFQFPIDTAAVSLETIPKIIIIVTWSLLVPLEDEFISISNQGHCPASACAYYGSV